MESRKWPLSKKKMAAWRLKLWLNPKNPQCPVCGGPGTIHGYYSRRLNHATFANLRCTIIYQERRYKRWLTANTLSAVWFSFEFTYLSNQKCHILGLISVWLSFEFTYLSNGLCQIVLVCAVWLSFEFTYLSNKLGFTKQFLSVWLSFEFTYLSNNIDDRAVDIKFDYPLNLHISQTQRTRKGKPGEFDYPLNLHISQTRTRHTETAYPFDYPLNLHISQTGGGLRLISPLFDYPLNLHISQTGLWKLTRLPSLIILWIYISLKPNGSWIII